MNLSIEITDKTYDQNFVKKVEEISGENFHKCMQCGTCSGGCPMADKADIPPRKLMLMTHMGLQEDVTKANTVWLCATCNTCTVRCPRGVNLPKVFEAIRLLMLRENKDHVNIADIPKEILQDLPQIALVSCFRKHTS